MTNKALWKAGKVIRVDLLLKSTDEDLKTWPHRFELRLRISVTADKLTVIPRVRNVDSKPFSFTFALCSYLSLSDIRILASLSDILHICMFTNRLLDAVTAVEEGLETLDYFDNLLQRERYSEQADAISFDGEVERVYLREPMYFAKTACLMQLKPGEEWKGFKLLQLDPRKVLQG
ncbi:hypothetical protein SASPL_145227 [Salvia splendens]|uniref:Uncharacterized protein n=1 Tax=Salvia splendens TaxID=180675 RepID=A0A8X8WI36_SALSN|nr:hypothetical protein SASPL_145227 [Salvia splendens]